MTSDSDSAGKSGPAPGKAKIILPKVRKQEGGFHPGGANAPRGDKGQTHGQTHDRKPPRLPGRNG
jgi:hypothetical protein